jgi:hypothetical protein
MHGSHASPWQRFAKVDSRKMKMKRVLAFSHGHIGSVESILR